jgi:hypothetical protein
MAPGRKNKARWPTWHLSREYFHVVKKVLVEGMARVPRPMLAAGIPNSPWTPLFHHNLRCTTQKGLPFASIKSSLEEHSI